VRKIRLGILVTLCVAVWLFGAPQPAGAGGRQAVSARDLPRATIHYYAVDFVDAVHGWVAGITYIPPGSYGFEDTAIIGRTDSGGENWQYSTSHEAGQHSVGWNFRTVTAIDFIDGLRGWATLDDGTILATGDGGKRWSAQAEGSFEHRDNNWGYADLAMADAAHGCAVGSWVGFVGTVYPRIVYTEDGSEWKEADIPKPAGCSLESVCMVDVEHGWAVGSAGPGDKVPLVLVTDDGGATWTRQFKGLLADGLTLHGVWFVDREHGWAVGDSGTIYVTADGGTSWWRRQSGVSADLLDVRFDGAGVGWVVGEGGTVLETTQAGRTWVAQSSGVTGALRALASAAGSVWAVGDQGTLLRGVVPGADPAGAGFGDISSSRYRTAIESLAAAGVVGGFLDGSYRPEASLNRAQLAKMIVTALGLAPAVTTATGFTDLGVPDAGGYPHRYVQSAFDNGITKGIDAAQTRFAPWDPIRRDQVVTMIVRGVARVSPGLLKEPPAGHRSPFDGVGAPHGENLRLAEYNGLLDGLDGLDADWGRAHASRGEAAQLLYNLMLR